MTTRDKRLIAAGLTIGALCQITVPLATGWSPGGSVPAAMLIGLALASAALWIDHKMHPKKETWL